MKFSYSAFDKSGKLTAGAVDAASLPEARENLRRQGLFVTRLEQANEQGQQASGSKTSRLGTGARLKNLAMFSRQLHVLVASGTPIVQALSAIERQSEHDGWRRVLSEL